LDLIYIKSSVRWNLVKNDPAGNIKEIYEKLAEYNHAVIILFELPLRPARDTYFS